MTDNETSIVWRELSDRVDRLVAAWDKATEPPDLGQFLPEGPASLRRLALVESIKVDLDYRWQGRRWPKLIEEYLQEFPELATDGGVPCDLIYEEFHVRKQHGDLPSLSNYCERFPARCDELRRLCQFETQQSTLQVATQRVPTFEAGQKIDDFDLISTLGKGAFASVFLARQCSMQRMVALKISRDKGFEPQTLAQLEHPNIVRVFDQRQLAAEKLRLLYMQYVPGGTLHGVVEHARRVSPASRSGATLLEAVDQALLKNGEQPPGDSMTRYRLQNASWPEAVCWLGSRLASALAYAHQQGILHRDIKPANVLVGADGHPKLADFNISFSKLDGATPAAYFGGTVAYMSPEQIEACNPAHDRQPDSLDGRTDVYSLGVMLWELLTLKRPFAREGLTNDWSGAWGRMAMDRQIGITPEVRKAVPADCPKMLVEVLLKCVEPDPDKRYASAGELARALDLCLQPRAQALLYGRGTWRSLLKHYPVSATLLLGVIPNVIMCLVNIGYNKRAIMDNLGPDDLRVFMGMLVMTNVVAYTVGFGYVFYSRTRLFLTVSRLAGGRKVDPPPATEMLRKCLTFGLTVAVVTSLLWTVSGFLIPAWIHLGAGEASRLTATDYRMFVISNLLCGMIAATQSYYSVTFLSVRFCYPWLFEARAPESRQMNDLADVARRSRVFLGLTVLVLFAGLLALVLLTFERIFVGTLVAIGLVGCGLAYLLDLAIRGDLSALATAMNPSGDALAASDTIDSFLSTPRTTRSGGRR